MAVTLLNRESRTGRPNGPDNLRLFRLEFSFENRFPYNNPVKLKLSKNLLIKNYQML